MSKMLLISQNGTDTWFVNGISIGKRDPRNVWGDKIKEVLKEQNHTEEEFINQFGNSYRESVRRVLRNEEMPKKQIIDKILELTGKELGFFHDKQLKNVIVNDSRLIVAEYDTDARAKDVKKEMDVIIEECYRNGQPIILKLPEA